MAMHGERIYLLEQATTQMKYRQSANSVRIIRTALRYRRLFSPWARVGDSTWGKFGGDLDLDTPGGEGAGRRQAPGSRDAGMGCVVRSRHRFGGKGLRGFQLRGLRDEKKQRLGRFFSPDGSRRRVGTMPGIVAIAID